MQKGNEKRSVHKPFKIHPSFIYQGKFFTQIVTSVIQVFMFQVVIRALTICSGDLTEIVNRICYDFSKCKYLL